VLVFSAWAEADPPSKEPNRLSISFIISELILYGNRLGSIIRQDTRKEEKWVEEEEIEKR
jgi:hypothetical protein